MQYINNEIKNGILYDFKKILKRYNEIVPRDYNFPCKIPFSKSNIHVLLSERNTGKTTNLIIIGMIMNQEYGTIIEYVRDTADAIKPLALCDLLKTINEYDYISKITNGRWNNAFYKANRWYFCNIDDNGEITEQDSTFFMHTVGVNKATLLKSSYNSPKGDIIIFDEFIGNYYRPNEFAQFLDLCSTIIRGRFSAHIFMVANTIDRTSPYFDELEIREYVDNMEKGDSDIVTTSKGTTIYISYMESMTASKSEIKQSHNKKYFGFSNGRINAITGDGWALSQYPHITARGEIITYRYFQTTSKIFRATLEYTEKLGLVVNIVPTNAEIPDDEIVYTLGEIIEPNTRYRVGYSKIDKLFIELYRRNKWYYATNSVGAYINNYIKQC